MLITKRSSILVTPSGIAAPHFKSTGYEPSVIRPQTLLYRAELLIFIYTPIKSEISVVHLIPLFSCVLHECNSHGTFHHYHAKKEEGFVAIHVGFGEGTGAGALFATYWTSPRAKARRDFSRCIFQQAGTREGGRKEKHRWPSIRAFESLDSKAGEKGKSIFVMFMKGKPKNRKKERASRVAFRERGQKLFSKSVVLPDGARGQRRGCLTGPLMIHLILMECKDRAHIMLCIFIELMPALIDYPH